MLPLSSHYLRHVLLECRVYFARLCDEFGFVFKQREHRSFNRCDGLVEFEIRAWFTTEFVFRVCGHEEGED